MRRAPLICILTMAFIALVAGCESSTEPEQPRFKNGSSPELAIEMPPLFPPPPRYANVTTQWWVLQAGELWFRNAEKDPINLALWVTEVRTGIAARVGVYALNGFETKAMTLDDDYTTNTYRGRDWSWHLTFQQRNVNKTILVGVAD